MNNDDAFDGEHTEFKPSKLNECIRSLHIMSSICFCCFGAILTSISLYYYYDAWATLDPETFKSMLLMLSWTGAFTMIVALFCGCIGAVNQIVKHPWYQAGRKLLGCYELFLITVLIVQFEMLIYTLNTREALLMVEEKLPNTESWPYNSTVSYEKGEEDMNEKFNRFYFDTIDDTSDASWFWSWVHNNCPSDMSADNCETCVHENSCTVSGCPNEVKCFDEDSTHYCPYEICRPAVVEKVIEIITPVTDYGIFVCVFELIVIILTCLLVCYHPRSSEKDILLKTGTITVVRTEGQAVVGKGAPRKEK